MKYARSNERFGFTLVELLIALTIASALTAIALPTLKDSMRQNTLSRSASLIKGAFLNARGQAIRTGRPFGIVIERRRKRIGEGAANQLDFLPANYSTRMYYVQSPIEYRGDSNSAVAYPVFEGPVAGPQLPRFFIPQRHAGVLAASAQNGVAAQRLISIGTRFSIGDTGYVFEVRRMTHETSYNSTSFTFNEPGTILDFNFRGFSPESPVLAGIYNTALDRARFPAGLEAFQGYEFRFQTNPVPAALAPVTLTGKTVIDLSVSGTASDPLAFNAQAILDPNPAVQIPDLIPDPADPNPLLKDVMVMFAPDGRMDGIYSCARDDSSGTGAGNFAEFTRVRLNPASSVSFNVGFIDGILDNIDDGARYPYAVPGTDYQINADDPVFAEPPLPGVLDPRKVPNFANPECAWISLHPLSGAVSLESVASQPPLGKLSSYYGFNSNPGSQTARNVMRSRLHQARRLTTAGAIQ